jgi:hypothetical protein
MVIPHTDSCVSAVKPCANAHSKSSGARTSLAFVGDANRTAAHSLCWHTHDKPRNATHSANCCVEPIVPARSSTKHTVAFNGTRNKDVMAARC